MAFVRVELDEKVKVGRQRQRNTVSTERSNLLRIWILKKVKVKQHGRK